MPHSPDSVLVRFIRNRPLVSFFILTYLFTWSIWIPISLLLGDANLANAGFLAAWGTYGPALMAMFISAILNREKGEKKTKIWILALILVWALAVAVRVTLPDSVKLSDATHTVVLSSLAAGVVFAGAFSSNRGIKDLLSSLVRPRGGVLIHVLALVLVPGVFLGLYMGQRMLGQEAQFRLAGANPLFAAYLWFGLVAMKVFHNNMLGEEVGWRGFALPRLQNLYSPLTASLILGVIWAVWHYPLWRMEGLSFQELLLFSVLVIPLSIIHTWFWNRSGGSIWVVGLLHATCNVRFALLPQSLAVQLTTLCLIALVLVLADRMWRRM